MTLPTRYNKCIWCIRPLNASEINVSDSPTDEHIFPVNIFGVVITRDCCKDCNSRLGNEIDIKLLADERILLAAREAGINENELLLKYSGTGSDSKGQQVQYTVKQGKWRLEPNFHQQGFTIGLIDGKTFPKDVQNAKAKVRSLAEADRSLQLTPTEREKCVEDLFDTFLAGSGKSVVYCDKINQRLSSELGPKHIKIPPFLSS
jgi:hypothetical protein